MEDLFYLFWQSGKQTKNKWRHRWTKKKFSVKINKKLSQMFVICGYSKESADSVSTPRRVFASLSNDYSTFRLNVQCECFPLAVSCLTWYKIDSLFLVSIPHCWAIVFHVWLCVCQCPAEGHCGLAALQLVQEVLSRFHTASLSVRRSNRNPDYLSAVGRVPEPIHFKLCHCIGLNARNTSQFSLFFVVLYSVIFNPAVCRLHHSLNRRTSLKYADNAS